MIPLRSSSGVDEPPKHRSRRTGAIIGTVVAWAVVLLVVVSCVATQLVQPRKNNRHTTLMKGTKLDPQACLSAFAGFPPHAIFNGVLKVLIGAVEHTVAGASNDLNSVAAAGLERSALQDCIELLNAAVDDLSFPRWLSPADLTLLQVPQSNVRANAVVALDGTGNYKSVTEAVNGAPDNSNNRYLIHVKAGLYHEHIVIHKNKTNLMFIGDGMDCTIITGNKNFIDGTSTHRSATFGVRGNGFIARDIGFENTAGPHKYQAVALRVGSDESMFYRCSMKGYQDTLYVRSSRQFYRDCKIYGTVDFIFGNAAVVFQNCAILLRKPLPNQFITITAQSRKHPNQNTGMSFHNCSVTAAPDLAPVKKWFAAYLGRPWQRYSRTAFLHSYLDDIIRPEGWAPWNSSNFALDTLYYGEYLNRGPGAALANRVKWRGFHAINTSAEANQFSVAQLIEGKKGLPPN